MILQEEQQQANDNARRGRKYTEPRRTTDEAMRDFANRQEAT
jgi:hypothetical protein